MFPAKDHIYEITRVQVVPLTSKTDRLYLSEAVVIFKGNRSKAMTDHLTTVSKSPLFKRAGFISEEDMRGIEEAVKYADPITIHVLRCENCRKYPGFCSERLKE